MGIKMVVAALIYVPVCALVWNAAWTRHRAGDVAGFERQRGEAALAAKQWKKAEQAFARAWNLRPQDPEIAKVAVRAQAYVYADDTEAIRPEDFARWTYELDGAEVRDPGHAAVYLVARGHLAARRGQRAEAEALYTKALDADDRSVFAHNALGFLLMNEKGSAALAQKHFEKVLEADRNHVGALFGLARISETQERMPEATKYLERAVKAKDDGFTRMALGGIRFRSGKHAEALEDFLRAAEARPQEPRTHAEVGRVLIKLERYEEAELALSKAVEIEKRADYEGLLAIALNNQKKFTKARTILAKLIAAGNNKPGYMYSAGVAAEGLGLEQEAQGYFRAISGYPPPADKSGQAYLYAIQALARKKLTKSMERERGAPLPPGVFAEEADMVTPLPPNVQPQVDSGFGAYNSPD